MGLFSRFRHFTAPTTRDPPAEVLESHAQTEEEKGTKKYPELHPHILDAVDVMADMVYRNCWPLGWFSNPIEPEKWSDEVVTGVCLRSKYGSVRSCPGNHPGFAEFEEAIIGLNAKVAIKLQSKAVEVAMKNFM